MTTRHKVTACIISCCTLWACAADVEPLPALASARVLEIVDGDTIVVTLGKNPVTIRLIGIDTPETKKPSWPVECFGPEATTFIQSLIPPGTALILHRDVESRDHFGRLLAYVFRHDDGLFVNQEIMTQGFARPLSIAPNLTYSQEFAYWAGEARRERRGLWKAC